MTARRRPTAGPTSYGSDGRCRAVVQLWASTSERDLQGKVAELASLRGWLVYHTWMSLHSPSGYPDLTLVRPPRVLHVEIKSESGLLSAAQVEWGEALLHCPGEYYVWRPHDELRIAEILE